MRYHFAKVLDFKGKTVGLVYDIKIYEDGSYRFAEITIDSNYVKNIQFDIYIKNNDISLPFDIRDHECKILPNGAVAITGTIYELEGEYL